MTGLLQMTLSCAQCAKELADAQMCGLCKERRVPDAAYYCSKACAKAHWKAGHKRWHEKARTLVGSDAADDDDGSAAIFAGAEVSTA